MRRRAVSSLHLPASAAARAAPSQRLRSANRASWWLRAADTDRASADSKIRALPPGDAADRPSIPSLGSTRPGARYPRRKPRDRRSSTQCWRATADDPRAECGLLFRPPARPPALPWMRPRGLRPGNRIGFASCASRRPTGSIAALCSPIERRPCSLSRGNREKQGCPRTAPAATQASGPNSTETELP